MRPAKTRRGRGVRRGGGLALRHAVPRVAADVRRARPGAREPAAGRRRWSRGSTRWPTAGRSRCSGRPTCSAGRRRSSSCTSSRAGTLVDRDAAVGVASAIWPHGRWRFDFTGRADHAGTTRMEDRADPMLTFAMTVLAANKQARLAGARATFGRVEVVPGTTNVIPSRVSGWLDARAPRRRDRARDLVDMVTRQARERAERDGTGLEVTAESVTAAVEFEAGLRDRLAGLLGGVPVLRDRRRTRRRRARCRRGADRDAVRPQPDRHLARARRARRHERLHGRRRRRWPTCWPSSPVGLP